MQYSLRFTLNIVRLFACIPAFALLLLNLASSTTAVLAQAPDHTQVGDAGLVLPEVVSFNAHIRPLMSNTCFVCHGPDDQDNDSGYRVDSFEAATSPVPSDSELPGIRPGDAEGSAVIQRIMAEDVDQRMPPADFRHQLSDYERALIQRWVNQGAQYQQHWAYAPVVRPQVPELKVAPGLIGNPIDAFVLAKLQQLGIEASPPADKASLLRRVSLDLIGLPPTPEELAEFLADSSDEAYPQVVERLLESPQFGERMAAYWLDLVRFADTVGFHGDQNQRIFPYRDYVIQAFNTNKPFDEFTREQLAGDLLPNPTEEQLAATGFLRLNMVTREGGAQPGEYLAKSRADRVRALGTAWLGSTLGCCECHNHKYDPFSTKDFYAFGAFFDDLRQWGVYADYGYTPNADLKGFNNDYPFPPELRLRSSSAVQEIQALQKERDQLLNVALGIQIQASPEFQTWLERLAGWLEVNAEGWIPSPIIQATTTHATQLELLDDGSLLLSAQGDAQEQITAHVHVAAPVLANAIRVEILPDARHAGFVGRGADGQFSLELSVEVQPARRTDPLEQSPALADESDQKENGQEPTPAATAVAIAWAEADRKNPMSYRSGYSPDKLTGKWRSGPAAWQLPTDEAKLPHTAIYHFKTPLELTPQDELLVKLQSGDIGRVRISVSPIGQAIPGWPAVSADLAAALRLPADNRSPLQQAQLISAYHRSTQAVDQQHPLSTEYRDRILKLQAGMALTLIAQSLPADQLPTSRVLPRGNWQDTSGELVEPSFPGFLPAYGVAADAVLPASDAQPPSTTKPRLTRLDLAEWLVSDEHPLTPRHFVNRTWKQFFGSGLSAKLDDLGNQGEWPSHPLLLDWLAAEFVESGWDVKHLIRTIVSSRTYQQAAAVRSELPELDPYNRLLAQQSARRLEAEAIRDNALAISGLLSNDYVGGPSVFPYQPDGHYDNLQFPDRSYTANRDYRQYRRGLYMHWQRTFLHPMLVNFDAPSRDECTAERPISNSPQQALTLLNDPTFVEAAHALAGNLMLERPQAEFESLLESAFLRALARPPSDREYESLQQLYADQLAIFKDLPQDAAEFLQIGEHRENGLDQAELAAFAQVCRVILNLHEVITRY